MFRRLDRYTDLKAQDLREHGGKTGIADNARRGLQRFWKCYVRRGGWREGGWGLLISMMAGLYPLLSALRVDLDRPAAAIAAAEPSRPGAGGLSAALLSARPMAGACGAGARAGRTARLWWRDDDAAGGSRGAGPAAAGEPGGAAFR